MEIHSQSRPEGRARSFVGWMMSSTDRASYSHAQQNNNNKKKSEISNLHWTHRDSEEGLCWSNVALKLTTPIFPQLKINPLCMKTVLCVGKPTNWGWGKTMWHLRYLVTLSTMSLWGASPPHCLCPPPTTIPSALVMRPCWIEYSPSAQRNVFSWASKLWRKWITEA